MLKLPLKNKEAFLVTDSLTIEYLTGIKLAEGFLVYSSQPTCLVDARYFGAIKSVIESKGVTPRLYTGLKDIKHLLKEQRVKKLFVDFDRVTVSEYYEYLDLGVKLFDGSRALKLARAVKEKTELDKIKKACEIAQTAMSEIINDIKPNVTESFIRDKLENKMLELGADSVSFETIVAFGENSAIPHHQTGETVLEKNSAVLIDMGCKYKGYCSDITRTFFYGEPPEKFIDCYNAVLLANQTTIEKIKDGDYTDVADGYARKVLKDKGLEEYFTHSLGHGLGLEIHEFPALSPKKREYLEEGMTFTIEPGVYFEGEFGIRIEDTVTLTENGVVRLYSDSKELKIIK